MRATLLAFLAFAACSSSPGGASTTGGESSGTGRGSSSAGASSAGSSSGGGSGATSGTAGSSGGSSGVATGSSSAASSGSTGGSNGSTTRGSSGSTGSSKSGSCIGTDCSFVPDGGSMIGGNCGCEADCCGDGLHCVFSYGNGICEPSCGSNADCPEPYTACARGLCAPVFCGSPTANGQFSGPCTVVSPGDGMCSVPVGGGTLVVLDGGGWLGLCVLTGTAATGTACDATGTRSDSSQLCVSGDVCAGQCLQTCGADGGCPAGKSCRVYCECSEVFTACF